MEALNKARERKPKAVFAFDRKNKRIYVDSRIGREPVRPTGLGKLIRSKMNAYEKEYAEYKAKRDECVSAYYKEYAEKRRQLESDERLVIAHDIDIAERLYDLAVNQLEEAHRELTSDETLSENLKKTEIVDALISYVRDCRADSVKEAINLYFEEEHRRRLEELAQEQVRITTEAMTLAREARKRADEAVQEAHKAMRLVNSAHEEAKQAHWEAQNAYREAQHAYWAATSNGGSSI